jgi:hypothetical protein
MMRLIGREPMSDKGGTGCFVRIVVGAILMPLAGATAFSLVWSIAVAPLAGLLVLPVSLYGAFPLVGIQAVVYSALMEFAVWRTIGINCLAILISALLGLVSGGLACGISEDFLPNFLFAGFVAGLVTGLVLRALRRRSEVGSTTIHTSPTPNVTPSAECPGACFVERHVSQ